MRFCELERRKSDRMAFAADFLAARGRACVGVAGSSRRAGTCVTGVLDVVADLKKVLRSLEVEPMTP